MKLTGKLIQFFLVISIVPVVIVGYLAFDIGRQTIEKNMIEHLTTVNNLKLAELTRWIEEGKRSCRHWRAAPLSGNSQRYYPPRTRVPRRTRQSIPAYMWTTWE